MPVESPPSKTCLKCNRSGLSSPLCPACGAPTFTPSGGGNPAATPAARPVDPVPPAAAPPSMPPPAPPSPSATPALTAATSFAIPDVPRALWVCAGGIAAMFLGLLGTWATIFIVSVSGLDTGDGKLLAAAAALAAFALFKHAKSRSKRSITTVLVLGVLFCLGAIVEIVDFSRRRDGQPRVGPVPRRFRRGHGRSRRVRPAEARIAG